MKKLRMRHIVDYIMEKIPKNQPITKGKFEGVIKNTLEEFVEVQNASPSEEADGSMIEYWEEETGINLKDETWECPMCGEQFEREDLDGAHVVYINDIDEDQFITPLCNECNRGRSDEPFWVKKEFLVPAP